MPAHIDVYGFACIYDIEAPYCLMFNLGHAEISVYAIFIQGANDINL